MWNLQHIDWERGKQGLGGKFYKCKVRSKEKLYYYKLSEFKDNKFIGIESIIEVMVSRLGIKLGFPILPYIGNDALVKINDTEYQTYACLSPDFLKEDEKYIELPIAYQMCKSNQDETIIDFCKRIGIWKFIEKQIVFDYLVINQDRHGGNTGVIIDKNCTVFDADKLIKRVAPIFDNGYSLTFWCENDIDKALREWDYKRYFVGNNCIGSESLEENLKLITNPVKIKKLTPEILDYTFSGFEGKFPESYIQLLKNGITYRYNKLLELGATAD